MLASGTSASTDSNGAFGPQAESFVEAIAQRAEPDLRFETLHALISTIAIAIQRGNARILIEGLHLANKASRIS